MKHKATKSQEPVDQRTIASILDETGASASGLTAKRDFVISQNEYFRKIKTGDDLSDVPEMFLQNLKTEKVI